MRHIIIIILRLLTRVQHDIRGDSFPNMTIILAITSGYVSLRECTLPTGRQRMRNEIISLPESNDLQARDAGDTELSDSYQKTF